MTLPTIVPDPSARNLSTFFITTTPFLSNHYRNNLIQSPPQKLDTQHTIQSGRALRKHPLASVIADPDDRCPRKSVIFFDFLRHQLNRMNSLRPTPTPPPTNLTQTPNFASAKPTCGAQHPSIQHLTPVCGNHSPASVPPSRLLDSLTPSRYNRITPGLCG
jgi:hypothetical protein